jgi:hypothetical protein
VFEQVGEIIGALKSAGVRDVSLDPAEVNVPGIWVKPPVVAADVLEGYTLTVDLVLVVEPMTPSRALDVLDGLITTVVGAVGGPSGLITPGSVIMPDKSVCPCYTYPLQVATETNGA